MAAPFVTLVRAFCLREAVAVQGAVFGSSMTTLVAVASLFKSKSRLEA
jgi:hypothetical protein